MDGGYSAGALSSSSLVPSGCLVTGYVYRGCHYHWHSPDLQEEAYCSCRDFNVTKLDVYHRDSASRLVLISPIHMHLLHDLPRSVLYMLCVLRFVNGNMDVDTAFLKATPQEDIDIKLTSGYPALPHGMVLKLSKTSSHPESGTLP